MGSIVENIDAKTEGKVRHPAQPASEYSQLSRLPRKRPEHSVRANTPYANASNTTTSRAKLAARLGNVAGDKVERPECGLHVAGHIERNRRSVSCAPGDVVQIPNAFIEHTSDVSHQRGHAVGSLLFEHTGLQYSHG